MDTPQTVTPTTEIPENIDEDYSVEHLYQNLITEAHTAAGDTRIFEEGRDIEWLDMNLAQSGQAFFSKNYASLVFAHALYFIIGFGFKPVTGLVIRTGSFYGESKTTYRLLSTIWHVLKWYSSDIIGIYSSGLKAINNVRTTHEAMRKKWTNHRVDIVTDEETLKDPIGDALRADLNFLDTKVFDSMALSYNPQIFMDQFSITMTQISFLLPVLAHPEAFGISDLEYLDGFEHLWALIGNQLGIQYKFNIPIHSPGKEFYVKFWKEIFLPSLLVRDSHIIKIQDSFLKNVRSYTYMPSIPGCLYFYLSQSNIPEFKGNELWKLTSYMDRISIYILKVVFGLCSYSDQLRNLVNLITLFMVKRIMTRFGLEEAAEGREFTYLPPQIEWSRKYRKPSEDVRIKWKKSGAVLNLMTAVKAKQNKRYKKFKARRPY